MFKTLRYFLLLVVVVPTCSAISFTQQQAGVVHVPQQFSTISEALASSPAGTLIEVDAARGPYTESLMILDNVSLLSVNGQARIVGKTPRPECDMPRNYTRCEKDRVNLILMVKDSSIKGFEITGEFDTWTHISCADCKFTDTTFLDTNIIWGGKDAELTHVIFDYSPALRPIDPNNPTARRENEDQLLFVMRTFNTQASGVEVRFYQIPDDRLFL